MPSQDQVASPRQDVTNFVGCLELLKRRTRPSVYESWFQKLELVSVADDAIKIGTQNPYVKRWIEDPEGDLLAVLTQSLAESFGRPLKPELVITPREGEPEPEQPATSTGAAAAPTTTTGTALDARPARTSSPFPPVRRLEPDSSVQLKGEYVFESYIVGPSNRIAHAAAHAVAKNPGRDYNPLFVHSNVGLGKTHLLQAICHQLMDGEPRPRILYLSCEEFVNRFVTALRDHALEPFRMKHRSVDVLVIDDIHFLADKPQIQEEFFHTFNALYNAQKQIILSSDSHPSEIPTLETRAAIIKKKAQSRGHELDDEVAALLAQRIDSNVRELEGALNRLIGTASLTNTRIDREFAQQVLRDLLGDDTGSVHINDISEVVCVKFKVKLTDLQSKRRTKKIAFARHVAMHLARNLTELTLADIGSHFGGKDHTTVLYADEKIKSESERSPETRTLVEDLKREARCKRSVARS